MSASPVGRAPIWLTILSSGVILTGISPILPALPEMQRTLGLSDSEILCSNLCCAGHTGISLCRCTSPFDYHDRRCPKWGRTSDCSGISIHCPHNMRGGLASNWRFCSGDRRVVCPLRPTIIRFASGSGRMVPNSKSLALPTSTFKLLEPATRNTERQRSPHYPTLRISEISI